MLIPENGDDAFVRAINASAMGLNTSLRILFKLVTEEELALLIGVTPVTLQTWRANREGPAYVKLGRAVFYRHEDLERWIKTSVVEPVTVLRELRRSPPPTYPSPGPNSDS